MSVPLLRTLREASPFFLIAGPCVIESLAHSLHIASHLKDMGKSLGIPIVFKASFDKANRQRADSPRGPGLIDGLAILKEVKEQTGLPVLTDIHEAWQAEQAGSAVDILQIPAYLCRQTDLVSAASEHCGIVNIKKGQFASAAMMQGAVEKVHCCNDDCGVIMTERGNSFGYGDLVVDPRNLVRMRQPGVLVVQDVTHSVQQSDNGNGVSGGCREHIPTIARMAAAVGVDGMFFETHDDPERAHSDRATVYPLQDLQPLLEELVAIANASNGMRRQ